MAMPGHAPSATLARRLRDGLERVANVLRSDRWSESPLNPTQSQILDFLCGRPGARVNAIAAHLRISQPSATDSIAALERKGLLLRGPDQSDGRAVIVALTEAGRSQANEIGAQVSAAERAIAGLSEPDQTALLALLVALIRNLQRLGAVDPQRMCVTCKYFRPFVYGQSSTPHHCAFADTAFGPSALRLDCAEHVAADEAAQAETWRTYEAGLAISAGPRSIAP